MITTHVLDTAKGKPAAGIAIRLERLDGDAWSFLASGATDSDGRLRTLMEGVDRRAGRYRLRFDVARYLDRDDVFFPEVTIEFIVQRPEEHYHVPLLLSPFGYSTYRGS